jgi:hypothetical protein
MRRLLAKLDAFITWLFVGRDYPRYEEETPEDDPE